MKASVDQDICIGCGLCESVCSEVFRMNDDNLSEAYGEVTEDNLDDAKDAAEQCPVECIDVEE